MGVELDSTGPPKLPRLHQPQLTQQVEPAHSASPVAVRPDAHIDRAQLLREHLIFPQRLLVHRRIRGRVTSVRTVEDIELLGPPGPVSFSRNGTCV